MKRKMKRMIIGKLRRFLMTNNTPCCVLALGDSRHLGRSFCLSGREMIRLRWTTPTRNCDCHQGLCMHICKRVHYQMSSIAWVCFSLLQLWKLLCSIFCAVVTLSKLHCLRLQARTLILAVMTEDKNRQSIRRKDFVGKRTAPIPRWYALYEIFWDALKVSSKRLSSSITRQLWKRHRQSKFI